MTNPKRSVTIRLDPKSVAQLDVLAANFHDGNRSEVVRRLLSRAVFDLLKEDETP